MPQRTSTRKASENISMGNVLWHVPVSESFNTEPLSTTSQAPKSKQPIPTGATGKHSKLIQPQISGSLGPYFWCLSFWVTPTPPLFPLPPGETMAFFHHFGFTCSLGLCPPCALAPFPHTVLENIITLNYAKRKEQRLERIRETQDGDSAGRKMKKTVRHIGHYLG